LALRDRVRRFYQEQGETITQKKLDRLVGKYGTAAAFDSALGEKYGKGLPSEQIGALIAEDVVGAAVYVTRAACLQWAAGATTGWLPESARVHARSGSTWWAKQSKPTRLALGLVAWGATVSAGPHSARLYLSIAWLGIGCWLVRPSMSELAPAELGVAMGTAWHGAGVGQRLGMLSAAQFVISAAAGPAHTLPCITVWALGALAVTNPPEPVEYHTLSFVDSAARKQLKVGMGEERLLWTRDLGLFSLILLQQSGGESWSSPTMAVGIGGKWLPLGSIKLAESKKAFAIGGLPLPAFAFASAAALLCLLYIHLCSGGPPGLLVSLIKWLVFGPCLGFVCALFANS
jgi:hypothetical protein